MTYRFPLSILQLLMVFICSMMFYLRANAQCDSQANFTWTASGCTVTFQALNTSGTDYDWSFDNQAGTTFGATGTNPTVTFPPSATPWKVRLAVDNEYGCIQTLTLFCYADCTNFGFTFEVERCDVAFTAPTGQGIVNYAWNFGDGYTASGIGQIPVGTNNGTTSGTFDNPTHNYASGGDFEVCLTVSILVGGEVIYDYVCCKTVQNVCSIGDCRDCDFTATPEINCGKLKVKFVSDCLDPGANHCWNFGDGSPVICGDFPTIEHDYVNVNTATNNIIATHSIYGQAPCSLSLNLPAGIFIGKDCETTNICSLVSSGVLPANSINGNNFPGVNIYLSGNLKIDCNYEFASINVFTGPGTQIDISAVSSSIFGRRTLRLTNGTYLGPAQQPCECMWEGIRVFRGGTLITGGSPRVQIAGAMYAVRVNRNSGLGSANPSLQLNNTDFRKNFIGLRATDGRFNMSQCSGNLFDGTGPLPGFCGGCSPKNDLVDYVFQQNQGYAGILVRGAAGTNSASLTINNTNTFQFLAAGIVIDNANATINRCKFFDIQRYGYPQYAGFGIRFVDNIGGRKLVENGLGKLDNNFNRVEHCIYAATDKQNTEASISINNMNNMQFGITVESPSDQGNGTIGNFKKVTVNTNLPIVNADYGFEPGGYGIKVSDQDMAASTNITVNLNHPIVDMPIEPGTQLPVGIWILGTESEKSSTVTNVYFNNPIEMFDGVDGIRIDNMSNAYVGYNEVFLEQTAPEGYQSAGVRFTGGSNNTAECNFILDENGTNEVTGIFVDGHTNGFYWKNNMFSTDHGLTFRMPCGDNNDIWSNIFWNDMDIALYYQGANVVTGPQFNKGNQWYDDNAAAGWGAVHEGFPNASPYKSVLSQIFTPALIDPPVPTWFTTDGTYPVTSGCDFATTGRQPDAAFVSSLDQSVANGSLTGFDPGAAWSLRQYLYRKLDEHPALVGGNSTLANFQSANTNNALGKLYEVGQDLRALFEIDASTAATIAANDVTVETAFGQLQTVDSLLTLQPEDSLLMVNRDNLLNTIEQATDANNALFDQWQASRSTAADAIIAANAAITTTGIPDGNEKQLNDLYLEKAAKNQWTLDAADMALLQNIAYQCPEYGGPAVYWARSWYAALTNTPINPFDCMGSRESVFAQVSSDGAFKVFPNPAVSEVWVACPMTDGGSREISLVDYTGRQLLAKQISADESLVKLETSSILAGLYFVRITAEGKTIHIQRVAIVK